MMASLHWSERNNVFLSALKTLFGVRRIRTQSIIRNKHSNICLPCFLRPQTRVPFRYSSNLQWKLKEKQQQQQNNNKITNRNQTLVKQKTNKKKNRKEFSCSLLKSKLYMTIESNLNFEKLLRYSVIFAV